jgi:hypothetical protein
LILSTISATMVMAGTLPLCAYLYLPLVLDDISQPESL